MVVASKAPEWLQSLMREEDIMGTQNKALDKALDKALWVNRLLQYGLKKGLIQKEDWSYAANSLFSCLDINGSKITCNQNQSDDGIKLETELGVILTNLLDGDDEAKETELMGCLMARPSEVISHFNALYVNSPKEATRYLHQLGVHSNYIKMNRIRLNQVWKSPSAYGEFILTINLSKPEKDPKQIAEALKSEKDTAQSGESPYPSCLLCRENEGYRGRGNHPARQNLRLIPVQLNHETWYLQFSPYAYYEEHCIVLSETHTPMRLSRETLARLLDFVACYPHYFIGSNADLPIVGGSILTHDHFQGGRDDFPMTVAPVEKEYAITPNCETKLELNGSTVQVGRVKWPMSVIRVSSVSKDSVLKVSHALFEFWKTYNDAQADVVSHSDGQPHNTITPICRNRRGVYEMDIVLRNNRTTEAHPEGLFHPHRDKHHIKKENIGLIEVMGLAVLPGRLKAELECIEKHVEGKTTVGLELGHHSEWIETLKADYVKHQNKKTVKEFILQSVGEKFETVLVDAGVYKRTETGLKQFDSFMEAFYREYDN